MPQRSSTPPRVIRDRDGSGRSPRRSPQDNKARLSELRAALREAENELMIAQRGNVTLKNEHLQAESRLLLFEDSMRGIHASCSDTIMRIRGNAYDEVTSLANALHSAELEMNAMRQEDEGAENRIAELHRWWQLSQNAARHIQTRGLQMQEEFQDQIRDLHQRERAVTMSSEEMI